MKNEEPRIGIDIGRVIIAPTETDMMDTSFFDGNLDRAMQTPPSPGAFEGVKTLVDKFEGQAWLVSKASKNMQRKTQQWLWHWNFYNITKLTPENVRFCAKRKEKAEHCNQLKLNFFIDDRLDVLEYLRKNVPHLYLFGEQPELDEIPYWVNHVLNWEETVKIILNHFDTLRID